MIKDLARFLLQLHRKMGRRQTRELDAYSRWNYIPDKKIYFELSADEWQLFHEAISWIAGSRRRVEDVSKGSVQGDFLVLNAEGSGPPIYWCFNNWAEPLLLARELGADQPLVAMHSLHQATEDQRAKTRFHEHLASRYLKTITSFGCERSLVIGGNCQGAPIAESIAIQASEQLNIQSSLITLDYVPRRQYQGPMLMLFGGKSRFNPFGTKVDPISIWQSRHNNFAWGFIDADHGEYFKAPAINHLRWFIEKTINDFIPTCSMSAEEIRRIAD